MSMTRRHFMQSVPATLAPLGLHASAQPLPPPGGRLLLPADLEKRKLQPVDPPAPARVLGAANARRRRGRGRRFTIATHDQPLAEIAALSYFDFSFPHGGRPMQDITLLRHDSPGQGVATVDFVDRDRGADAEIEAGWINLSHGRSVNSFIPDRTVFASRNGESLLHRVPDTPDRSLESFALTGFSFQYIDSGIDVRQFGVKLHITDPNFVYVAATFTDDSFVNLTKGFAVNVQYVWIPRALVARAGQVRGGAGGRRDSEPIPPGPAVIKGFHCKFLNAPHSVRRLMVTTHDGGAVRFHDNNENTPISWTLDYLLLRGT